MSKNFKNYKKSIVLDFNWESVKDGVPKASQQMALLNSEFRKQMAIVEQTGDATNKYRLAQERAHNAVKIQSEKVNTLTKELEKLESAENKNEKAITRKTIELNSAKATLVKYEQDLSKLNKQLTYSNTSFTNAANQILIYNESLKASGINLEEFADKGMKVGAVITGINIAGLKMSGDLDQIMAKTNTIADTTQVSLQELREGVLETSKVYNIHVNDVAEGLYNINSGNVETSKSLKLLGDSAKLSKAGFTDMSTSTKLLTQIINAYGLEVDDASDITDKLIKMQKLGQITVGEFGEGFGKLAGLASKANIPLEELMGSISTMTALGYEPAEAMTALSAVLTQIIKPSKQASDAAKKYGVELSLAAIESRGFAGWLEHVEQRTKGSDEALTELFGSANAIKSMFVLTGNGANKLTQDITELANSAGYTDEAISKMQNSTEKFSNAINRIKIALIEIGGALSPFLNVLAFFLEIISNIPKPILTVIAVGGTLLFGISAIIKSVLSLAKTATDLSGIFGMKLDPAMLKTLGVILLVISAVTILIALITTLTGKSEEAGNLLDKIGSSTSNLNKNIQQGQMQANRNVQGNFSSGVNRIANNEVSVNKLNGSHRDGIDYVPFDGYEASLHEGERVLTKEENINNTGGDTFNLNINMDEIQDVYDLISLFKQLKQTKRQGVKV